MGARKRNKAEARKEAMKSVYMAKLRNYPTSPRKMRLVADLIRGVNVETADGLLNNSKKEAARPMQKLLRSALSNFENKSGDKWENADLYIKEVFVDSARSLKRIQPAPQGRAHRILKRSNHVTLVLGRSNEEDVADVELVDNNEINEND